MTAVREKWVEPKEISWGSLLTWPVRSDYFWAQPDWIGWHSQLWLSRYLTTCMLTCLPYSILLARTIQPHISPNGLYWGLRFLTCAAFHFAHLAR